ncbi:glycosyltransferase family 2 protein [Candidatus Uhrbacteria bacterium]|nr:glycosyltransferase family 2 protein [Candidatus Uhrbacteria bacterium]
MIKRVFVIVITHNGEDDIGDFLETYRQYTPEDVSLVVVDNASSDNTLDIVRDRMPDVAILQNVMNRGYAGGAREGMEYALAQGAATIALVNQDLRFTQHWLEPMVEYLDSHTACAAVQPRIMMYPQSDIINSYGNAQHYLGFGYTIGYRKADNDYSCENGKQLATCSGAATLFRASALKEVGLIDEHFFMYYEDSDLSWRLRMAGYTLSLCCDSTVYHRYEFSRSIQKFYYMERNRLITAMANYSVRTLLLLAHMMLVMEAGMVGYSILGTLKGKRAYLTAREKLRSYAYFLFPSSWRYILQKRRVAQRIRKVSDHEIVGLFVDTIEFQDIDNGVLRRIVNPLMHWYWTWIQRII